MCHRRLPSGSSDLDNINHYLKQKRTQPTRGILEWHLRLRIAFILTVTILQNIVVLRIVQVLCRIVTTLSPRFQRYLPPLSVFALHPSSKPFWFLLFFPFLGLWVTLRWIPLFMYLARSSKSRFCYKREFSHQTFVPGTLLNVSLVKSITYY